LSLSFLAGQVRADRIELVSRLVPGQVWDTAGGGSSLPFGGVRQTLSSDGRWAVFSSFAQNLAPGQVDLLNNQDVLVYPGDLAQPPVEEYLWIRAGSFSRSLWTIMPLGGNGTLAVLPRLKAPKLNPTVHIVLDVSGYFE